MKFLQKNIFFIFLFGAILIAQPLFSQQKGEPLKHKLMWLRFGTGKKKDAFNPSVSHDKATHEQSRKQKREDARAIKKAKKEYKKSIRRSARIRKRRK
jgi:hypothetical protein